MDLLDDVAECVKLRMSFAEYRRCVLLGIGMRLEVAGVGGCGPCGVVGPVGSGQSDVGSGHVHVAEVVGGEVVREARRGFLVLCCWCVDGLRVFVIDDVRALVSGVVEGGGVSLDAVEVEVEVEVAVIILK